MVQIGAVLAGKYRIDRILGQGGMGIVVQAMHLQLGQPVALKFLLPEVLANAQVVQRFLREAQAAVRLRSEHVARVIDVGTFDDGAPFRLSSKCGNGVVDPGEDCDKSGETAMCDADCTFPKCGDGLRNAAAGEQCDTIQDTASCDSDCTVPVCGDGHINHQVEDCDDGNAIDNANGCSATCKFNNVCGDGTVQTLVESCDSGGVDTATCNKNCTTSFCGDGHLNTAANEQCDDGNQDETDHCTSMCKIN